MRVPENIRKCVGFVAYLNHTTGNLVPVGSVFFLGVDAEGDQVCPVFAVTARHVIDGLRKKGVTEIFLRLNLKPEEEKPLMAYQTALEQWFVHNADPSIDVAICPMNIPAICDHMILPTSMSLTQAIMQEQEVALGDEVFVAGLFRHHVGEKRNIPIIRTGNIAAFDEEPVQTRLFGSMHAYLIEARSIGGISGSPVFLNLGFVRSIGRDVKFNRSNNPMFFLMGLVHGHYDEDEKEEDPGDPQRAINSKINTGIAIVVPIDDIKVVMDAYTASAASQD